MEREQLISRDDVVGLLGVSPRYVDRLAAAAVLRTHSAPGAGDPVFQLGAVLAHRVTKEAKRSGIASILEAADDAGLPY